MNRTGKPLAAHSQAAWDAFQQRVRELGGTLLEPAWLGTTTLHRTLCPNEHECSPRPTKLLDGGHLCRTCSGKNPAVAEAEFRARLADAGATLLEPKYLGKDKPHRVLCAKGHECAPRPSNVRRGTGICRDVHRRHLR
ncbi:hypothetical protein [Streptomyces sp. NPDC056291]|uniref:hypothetical protein n=1 Tax=Streptomyces sp. NPDC056291 TaxID=3345772 RepID=UPI0035D7A9F2